MLKMQSQPRAGSRQSNLELLRIVSMLMVLGVHIDGASLGLPDVRGDFSVLTERSLCQLTVEALTIVGVNCFVLISGYFGIRLTWRSMTSFLFQCLFYSVGIYAVYSLFRPGEATLDGWLSSCMVLTNSDLWFVPTYFFLMLLSPLLNAGLSAMPRRSFALVLALFVVSNIWCGWLFGLKFNPDGYTVVQFIMLYMLGHYIRLRLPEIKERYGHVACRALLVYAFMIVCIVIYSIFDVSHAYLYNSPFVLGASCSLFVFFASLDFRSRAVNFIARSAFSVYLVHKSPVVWVSLVKPTVVGMWASATLPVFSLWAVAMVLVVYAVLIPVDAFRRMLQDAFFRFAGRLPLLRNINLSERI